MKDEFCRTVTYTTRHFNSRCLFAIAEQLDSRLEAESEWRLELMPTINNRIHIAQTLVADSSGR
jgi:hypothetical protein